MVKLLIEGETNMQDERLPEPLGDDVMTTPHVSEATNRFI